MAIFRRDYHNGNNRDFGRIAGYRSMSAAVRTTSAIMDGAVYRTKRHALVNLCLSQSARSTTTKRREQNRIQLHAAENSKWNLRSTYCTIEAIDRHKASRGLSATTAELLVIHRLHWTPPLILINVKNCSLYTS